MWRSILDKLPLFLSLVAILISWKAYEFSERTLKSQIQQGLANHEMDINEMFAKYKIMSPYEIHLKIEENQRGEFLHKVNILFKHINLLRKVYENRDVLGEVALKNREKWARIIVRPWLEKDDQLKKILNFAISNEDLGQEDREFLEWITELFPTLKVP